MGSEYSIKKFFSNMICAKCSKSFVEDSVNILREEDNYTVARVTCNACGKNIGIALLGLDKEDMKKCINDENESKECDPIGYNDVLDAHSFFSSLGSDWTKQIPNKKLDE